MNNQNHVHLHHITSKLETNSPTIFNITSTTPKPEFLNHHYNSLNKGLLNIKFFLNINLNNIDSNDHQNHMIMFFHGGSNEIILFDCWRINSTFGNFFLLN